VIAYDPVLEVDRMAMRNLVWHEREGSYDKSSPARTTEFHADGVMRQYQIRFNFPLSENHEIKVSHRMLSLDPGNVPYSLVTSDQFIEWFHSNISGGEDPFARKVYGLNQAKIRYTDANGKSMHLDNGDFIFSGMDLSYYYYPDFKLLEERNIYSHAGLQVGMNLSKVNPSLDVGLNFAFLKKMKLMKNTKELCIGVSGGAMRQKLVRHEDAVDFNNRKYLFSSEWLLEYVKHLDERRYISLATTWFIQSSYNKKRDYDFIVLSGDRITTHWHYAISHLYREITAHSLVLTYAHGNITLWIYIREDLLVDNAPDAQTGMGVRFNLASK
jgi:hypothetical protein